MAWITKPSATTSIPRRSEPYATEAIKGRWEKEIVANYATRQGALMPILHEIQHEYRCVPLQAMVEIAAFLHITPAEVLDTVTFYDEYTLEARGACTIGVCQSIACEFCGHQAIIDRVRERLGIEVGETTADGKFTLIAMECLGSCDTAPVALCNSKLHEGLTVAGIDRVLDEVCRGTGSSCCGGKGGH
ncbi:MAG: NAD(P)H-dependent oxidoreductase subunit E [Phycisphaerales bacterium]|nr:NAD(P)H-dependent oxidoreductase subunit E [Phycisphaerales bacterium]